MTRPTVRPPLSFALLLSVLGVLLCAPLARAQMPTAAKLSVERIGMDDLPNLKVYLTYTEPDGTPIMGKAAGDFKLMIDSADAGAAAKLVPFDQSKEPIYVVAVVQATPAVEPVISEVSKGLRQLADVIEPLPNSRMGLIAYATDPKRLVENGNIGDFRTGVGKLAVDPEGTEARLLEALRVAIDMLEKQQRGTRKLIILFSDGIDVNNDRKQFQELGKRAQQAGVVIDFIGYNPFEGGKLRNLFELSKNSYGVARGAKAPAEIGSKFSALADEISKQYLAVFPLVLAGDGKEHNFQVLFDAGKQTWSNNQNVLLKEFKPAPPPAPPVKPTRWWLWALLAGGLAIVGGVIYAATRKKPPAPQPTPTPNKIVAPMPTGGANKTVAIGGSGDVVMGWLLGLNGPYKDQKFVLKARIVIGTAPDCDIVLQDGYASSRHAEIRQAEGGFMMLDLGSTNGLLVNDKRVKEHFLVDNDAFRVGRTEFKFKSITG